MRAWIALRALVLTGLIVTSWPATPVAADSDVPAPTATVLMTLRGILDADLRAGAIDSPQVEASLLGKVDRAGGLLGQGQTAQAQAAA